MNRIVNGVIIGSGSVLLVGAMTFGIIKAMAPRPVPMQTAEDWDNFEKCLSRIGKDDVSGCTLDWYGVTIHYRQPEK
jgi:hypothetical protein